MRKPYLLTPGPVPVPDFIAEAIRQPVIHHRSEEFLIFYSELLEKLKYLFQTGSNVGTMIGSGTYGVECMIYSLFPKGSSVLNVSMGKFSDRWASYARVLGLDVKELKKDWGESPSVEEVLSFVRENAPSAGLILTHSETASGAILDLEEIAGKVKTEFPDLLIVVDGITSVGAMPYYHDEWGIDATVIASQKALMNPTGIVAFALSEAANESLVQTDKGDFRNVLNYIQAGESGNYPYSAPVQGLFGINAALDYIQDQTLPAVWNDVHQGARTFRKGLKAMGGKIWSEMPGEALTAFFFEGRDHITLQAELKKKGFELSGGQNHLKGKILRVSHMGLGQQGLMSGLIEALSELV